MDKGFWIDIGITVILSVLRTKKIPAGYVRAFIKLRDALNAVFPAELNGDVATGVQIVQH